MKLVSVLALSLLASPAFAGSIKVTDAGSAEYKFVKIEAEKVKGVEVVLKKEIVRDDCNQRMLDAKAVRVQGNEQNWWATFFVTAGISMTEMYCPLPEPVKETIESQKMVFESYTNPNINREVDITLIVPASYEVDVKELK